MISFFNNLKYSCSVKILLILLKILLVVFLLLLNQDPNKVHTHCIYICVLNLNVSPFILFNYNLFVQKVVLFCIISHILDFADYPCSFIKYVACSSAPYFLLTDSYIGGLIRFGLDVCGKNI